MQSRQRKVDGHSAHGTILREAGQASQGKEVNGVSVEHGLPEVVLSQWVPTFLERELAVKQEHARPHSLCDTR